MIITQTFTMARWQIVVKKSEATNQTKDQTFFFVFFISSVWNTHGVRYDDDKFC